MNSTAAIIRSGVGLNDLFCCFGFDPAFHQVLKFRLLRHKNYTATNNTKAISTHDSGGVG